MATAQERMATQLFAPVSEKKQHNTHDPESQVHASFHNYAYTPLLDASEVDSRHNDTAIVPPCVHSRRLEPALSHSQFTYATNYDGTRHIRYTIHWTLAVPLVGILWELTFMVAVLAYYVWVTPQEELARYLWV